LVQAEGLGAGDGADRLWQAGRTVRTSVRCDFCAIGAAGEQEMERQQEGPHPSHESIGDRRGHAAAPPAAEEGQDQVAERQPAALRPVPIEIEEEAAQPISSSICYGGGPSSPQNATSTIVHTSSLLTGKRAQGLSRASIDMPSRSFGDKRNQEPPSSPPSQCGCPSAETPDLPLACSFAQPHILMQACLSHLLR